METEAMNPNDGQAFPGAKPPPSSTGKETEGKVFYGQPGSTFIYSDGTVHVFQPGANIITDSEKIKQMDGAADKPSGLIHTRHPVEEVVVRKDKLAEAREAILNDPNNQKAAQHDPRVAELLEKAKLQAAANNASNPVPPLGAVNTTALADATADSNSTAGKK